MRIDITDQRGFARALETIDAAIAKVDAEDALQVLNQFQSEELSSMFSAYKTQKSNYAPSLKGMFQYLTTTHLQSAQVG